MISPFHNVIFAFLLQAFDKAAKEAKNLPTKPSDADMLELYALYKQVTVGDCNTGTKNVLYYNVSYRV